MIRYDMIWYDMMCMYYSIYTYTYYIVIYQNRSYYLPQRGILPATPLCVERRVWGSPSIRRGRTNMLRSVSSSTKRYPEQEWGWTRLGKFEATRITKKKSSLMRKPTCPTDIACRSQCTHNPHKIHAHNPHKNCKGLKIDGKVKPNMGQQKHHA